MKKRDHFEGWTRAQEAANVSYRRFGRTSWWLGTLGAILISIALVFVTVEVAGKSIAIGDLELGHKSERMKLTVPKMRRVDDIPVYTGAAGNKKKLDAGTLHLDDTGFPWYREANVYIAGHRLGYPRTDSFLVFYDLTKMRQGDKITLEDARGSRYVYRVFDKFVTKPNNLGVTKPPEGRNIVSLQTCTLPNYKQRLIVQGKLVRVEEPHPKADRAARRG